MNLLDARRHRTLWLVATGVLGALWLDFSSLHTLQGSDSLIPVLVSLQRWTPFYWGQHRFGMLIPWLALPVRQPLLNLLFQYGLTIFAGLSCFALVAAYLAPGRDPTAVALLSAALFIVFVPAQARFDHFIAQPYALSIALGVAGLLVLSPRSGRVGLWRIAISSVLTALAYWVNGTLAVLLVPLLLSRHVMQLLRLKREGYLGGGFRLELAVALVLNVAAQWCSSDDLRRHPDGNPYFETTASASWPAAWSALVKEVVRQSEGTGWIPQLLAVAGAGLLIVIFAKSEVSRLESVLTALALVATSAALLAVLGTNAWVARNGFAARYLLPAQLFMQIAVVSLWRPLLERRGRVTPILCSLALAVAIGARYGAPSPAGVRKILFNDPRAAVMVAAHCTHLAGDYWGIWPLVLQAMQLRYEQGGQAVPYGITTRSESTQSLWMAVPPRERVVCGPEQDVWGLGMATPLLGHPPRVVRQGKVFIAD